jgi:hypothetical protein
VEEGKFLTLLAYQVICSWDAYINRPLVVGHYEFETIHYSFELLSEYDYLSTWFLVRVGF